MRARFTDADLDHISSKNVRILIEIVRAGLLRDSEITFAVEFIGRDAGTQCRQQALDLLTDLASNSGCVTTREGAIYGLLNMGGEDARAVISKIAKTDKSYVIRECARDALTYG